MSDTVLSVRGLRTHFVTPERTVKAVDGVSYELKAGRTLAVVGESGSGKSVHALSILRLLPVPPARMVGGEILFRGEDILKANPKRMRELRGNRIAMIFQEPMTSLNPVLTVGEQIAEAIILHQKATPAQAWAKSVELLRKVGIPHPEERVKDYPHQFSGGMRQRAMIAIALSCEPDVLIADEPTTALDVTIQAQILDLMKSLQREYKMAIVLITHNIGVVAEMADDVIVMYAGRAVESAPIGELFKNPQHPYTKGLLASVPSIYVRKERLEAIPGQPPDLGAGFTGCPFAPRCASVMERCKTEDPPQFHLAAGRMSNCWLNEESSAQRSHRFEPAGESVSVAPLLEVRGLKKHFSARKSMFGETSLVKAVDGVSFSVMPQESFAIVGESGCGKTTLGKLVLALERPTEGQILFEGRDTAQMGSAGLKAMRRQMQVIFQDPYSSLNPRMTVESIITEPWDIHGMLKDPAERARKLQKLLDDCGIARSYLPRHPHEFSGGQRQRVGIARALALEPKLVVADEPVSALDVSIQAQILNLLKDLQRERKLAYLFISHDFSVVRHLCSRIAVMYLGRVVEQADSEALFNDPQHPYTEALLSAVPVPDPSIEKRRKRVLLTGDVPSPLDPPSGCHFHPRCRYMVDACRTSDPALADAKPGHAAACPVLPFKSKPSQAALVEI